MYKEGIPLVKFENNFYDLANLHIHSKNLGKYVSKDYVEYFRSDLILRLILFSQKLYITNLLSR